MSSDSSPSKTYCVLPWIHSFVNSNGNYFVCCTGEEHHIGIPSSDGKCFNIKDQPSPYEVMNSDFMKQVRKDMLEGKWHKACTRCAITEKDQGVSRRMIENKEFESSINDLIKNTKPDGAIEVSFKYIDYRLGNLCNLECRMCGPHSSKRWLKDWNSLKPSFERIDENLQETYANLNWIEKDYLLDEFKQKLKHTERLHFAGGEPLIAPQMAKMLRHCVDLDVAKNITLTYNTNTTKLPADVLELWGQFKAVKLLCSIDGFGKVNEYVRYPSKWDVIDKNLTYLDENFDSLKLKEILLSCTVQIYNVLELADLYDYLTKFKNIVPALNLINLHIPHYLRSDVLPPEVKKEATHRLTKIAEGLKGKLAPHYSYLVDNIYQVIIFMNQNDHSQALPLFYKVNTAIDNSRKIYLRDHIPVLDKIATIHMQKIMERQTNK